MPGVHRKTDLTTHPCNPASWSGNVYANSLNVVRYGDVTTCGAVYQGTRNVYVNSRDVQAIGDPVTCPSVVDTGSGDVFVN